MSDQRRVDEVSNRSSSEGIPDVQVLPERSSQNNGSRLRQNKAEKPEEMKTDKAHVYSDSIGVEPSLSPGIQEEAGVEGNRGARPDAGLQTGIVALPSIPCFHNYA